MTSMLVRERCVKSLVTKWPPPATASTENAHRHHAAAVISFSLSGVYARQITPFFLQAIDIDHGCAVLEASFFVDDLSELRKLIGSNKSDSAGRNA